MVATTESGSAASQAASGVDARRTTSNAERDEVTSRLDQLTDIGVDEAYQLAGLNQTRSWDANVKRTYDTLEEELHSAVKESQAHLAELHTVRVQMLTNMTVNCDNLQKQHTAHRDIATDRTWTQSNELENLLSAKSGVQADAIVTMLAKVVADAINANRE